MKRKTNKGIACHIVSFVTPKDYSLVLMSKLLIVVILCLASVLYVLLSLQCSTSGYEQCKPEQRRIQTVLHKRKDAHDIKLKFVYVVGVEGSGHHLMINIFENMEPFFPPSEEHMNMRLKQSSIWALYNFPWQKKEHIQAYLRYLALYRNQAEQSHAKYTHLYEDNSFPHLNPRNAYIPLHQF
jgi:hypothetical protein